MGYGFIEFDSHEEAAEALKMVDGKAMPKAQNKVFRLNWASYQNKSNNNINATEFSIYVCELDPSVNEEILKNHFLNIYPSVISAKIIVDPATKISKGYGFVKFSDYEESQKAISEMNMKQINGKTMRVGQASFKKNAVDPKKTYKDNVINSTMQVPGKTDNLNPLAGTVNPGLFYTQDQNALYNIQDPNIFQQQMYYYMANGYYPPNYPYYQMYPQYYPQVNLPNASIPQNANYTLQPNNMNNVEKK